MCGIHEEVEQMTTLLTVLGLLSLLAIGVVLMFRHDRREAEQMRELGRDRARAGQP